MEINLRGGVTLPGGIPRPPSGARPRRRALRRALGGSVAHGARPGTAQRSNVAPPPLGPPPMGKTVGAGCAARPGKMDQTQAAEAGSGDIERHLAGGDGAGTGAGGGALPVGSGGAYLYAQS